MTADLRERLGYRFRRPELLAQALTHRSHGSRHNERLEFVGDAVLNCVVAHSLYERFPEIDEGALSRVRASLVNRDALAEVARRLGMGEAILLGEGEQRSGGPGRPSILADALEALYGAVFLDAGYGSARDVIARTFGTALSQLDPESMQKDAKTRLQETLQAKRRAKPQYRVLAETGAKQSLTFEVECAVHELELRTTGSGSSRQRAEQQAAGNLLKLLQS